MNRSPQQLLRGAGLHPKKRWGQNFLVHEEGAKKIAEWSKAIRGDLVLEIGPGLGALTAALGDLGCRVVAIEIDRDLANLLRETWGSERWFRLIEQDALSSDLTALSKEEGKSFRVVANLPYSVSTPILEQLNRHRGVIRDMSLLLQEEVVDRITASPGTKNYGRLTIGIQTVFETERGPRIPRGSFFPVPDVESRLVRLTPWTQPVIPSKDLEPFLAFVSVLFQHRRKTFRNVIKAAGVSNTMIATMEPLFDLGRRPETFCITDLYSLFRRIR